MKSPIDFVKSRHSEILIQNKTTKYQGEFMKKSVLLLAVTLLSTSVFADIPNMGGGKKEEITNSEITGSAAEAVYESMGDTEHIEASLRTGAMFYKVQRAENGLDQVICHKSTVSLGRKRVTYRCEGQSSNTEKALPVYRPSIKMG
jgi:hypothetical protein